MVCEIFRTLDECIRGLAPEVPEAATLLEHFREATVGASEKKAGMEVKAAEAVVGGERRPDVDRDFIHWQLGGER